MSNLITPITIEDERYDKISDDLYIIGSNVVLRFNVSLSKNNDNIRNYFHKEYEYTSKYSNANTLITIRRSFDFFLSIENFKKDDITGIKEYIRIGIQEIMLLRYKLREVLRWFTDKEFENLFGKKGRKLLILGRVEKICIDRLSMDKYLEFEPVVCDFETESVPGVRIYLSSENNYADMSVDRFMGLYYLLESINMYESAQLMLNYLGRPENGTNLVSFSGQEYERSSGTEGISAKEGRRIPVKNRGLGDL